MVARRAREPQRTCVGCRQVRGKGDLVRIARATSGSVVVDRTGHADGRGAYVCPDQACIERARRRLAGALRTSNVDFTEISRELTVV
jgi:predicted RNA-binding protein YlxR (DUF448 family)